MSDYTLKRIFLGGTGEMHLLSTGQSEYLYKPAVRKYTNIFEPFRGIVQECGYEVQKIVDPDTAVVCKYVECDGLRGSVQERIKTLPDARDYSHVQFFDEDFTTSEVNQFLREFVTDYLLCNFDSHGDNFIVDENGVIRGIDKEQSFRYLRDPESEKPSCDYSPNWSYGTQEPIYNLIFRRYSEGGLNIDFNVLDKYMKRVEAVDNDTYREIFRPYCEACSIAFGSNSEEMLDKIVLRKTNMRSNIVEFYSNLTEMRKAKGK